jgi:broad specificity phosphatase PhoE
VPQLADRIYGSTDPDADVSEPAPFASLAKRLPADAVWFVSHLRRTRQTAEAIGQAGYALPSLTVEPAFGEQDFGELHGVLHVEHAATRTDPFQGFWPLAPDHTAPGGESFLSVVGRVSAAVERISAEHRDRDVVCVAHGGPILAALTHALALEPRNAVSLSITNLSTTRIHRLHAPQEGGPAWRVLGVGERA